MQATPIAVLGAGSWGTALAMVLARNGNIVHLWDIATEQVNLMAKERVNKRYLPEMVFPEQIRVFADLAEAVTGIQDLLVAVPSHVFGQFLLDLKPLLSTGSRIVWATKGLDKSGLLLDAVAREVLGVNAKLAVLSGPTFAKEVAQGLPSAIALAANDKQFAVDLKSRLDNPVFRVFISEDMIGLQLGGIVKNVLAIAAGISDGLGYGANTRCAILSRGLHEMVKLGLILGAQQETFMGLAGVGDLILTGTDNQSRNRRFGMAIGQGFSPAEALAKVQQVVEGYTNAAQIYQMAEALKVKMPIIKSVYQILYQDLPVTQAVVNFMSDD